MSTPKQREPDEAQESIELHALWRTLPQSVRTFAPLIGIIIVLGVIAGIALLHQNSQTTTSQSTSTTTDTGTNSQDTTAKLWDNNQHGILALAGSQSVTATYRSGVPSTNPMTLPVTVPAYLELLNPNDGTVLARQNLPSSLHMTQNSDRKQFTLLTDHNPTNVNEPLNYAFNTTHRYIAAQFDQASDGSQDVGYYDLTTGSVTDTSNNGTNNSFGTQAIADSDPIFDTNDPNLLLFCRASGSTTCDGLNDQNYSYDLVTKQNQAYTPGQPTWCPDGMVHLPENIRCNLAGKGPSAAMVVTSMGNWLALTPKGSNSTANDISVQSLQGGQDTGIQCTPIQWLDAKNIFCDASSNVTSGSTSTNGFLKVDLGDMVQKTTSDGTTIYEVPTPVSILPNNDRTNSNPVVSPDDAMVVFISAQGSNVGVYTVPMSGGQPKEIVQAGNAQGVTLLGWR